MRFHFHTWGKQAYALQVMDEPDFRDHDFTQVASDGILQRSTGISRKESFRHLAQIEHGIPFRRSIGDHTTPATWIKDTPIPDTIHPGLVRMIGFAALGILQPATLTGPFTVRATLGFAAKLLTT